MTGTREEQPTSRLGAVRAMFREDTPVMYLDVAFDVEAIQAGWPDFESRFTSRRGRRMMAIVLPERRVYRLATPMRAEDDPDSLGLKMGVLVGGPYLELALRGDDHRVHRDVAPAFDELRRLGVHDSTRPCVEVYRAPTEIDCLLPVIG